MTIGRVSQEQHKDTFVACKVQQLRNSHRPGKERSKKWRLKLVKGKMLMRLMGSCFSRRAC
jgi:hypothetical protein